MTHKNYCQGFHGKGKATHPANQMGRRHGHLVMSRLGAHAHHQLGQQLKRGGAWWDVFDPNKNGVSNAFKDVGAKIANEFTNPNSALAVGAKDFGNKALNEFTDPNSILRGQVLPIAADVGSVLAMAVPGAGPALSMGLRAVSLANKANQAASMFGVGHPRHRGRRGGAWKLPSFSQIQNAAKQAQEAYKVAQQYSPMVKDALNAYGGEYGASAANALGQVGLGRRRSGNDGRSVRAAIVRKVMMERGVNLPTASKIVKNEGLY